MSTPGTLPPPYQNYGYSHHQNYASTGAYLAHNPILNGGSRLGHPYNLPTPSNTTTGTATTSVPDYLPPSHSAQPRSEIKQPAIPASASMSKQPTKKRQRSKEPPDWENFYKNGLPKEVIIIDDSPPPEPSASVTSNRQSSRQMAAANGRHAAKKRKRDDAASAYDPVYQLGPDSNSHTPRYKESASGSTISTDRTTSAIHTTAATSLGSNSSNTQNGYEAPDVQPGQKRKRTGTATRLQLANEAKRKELEENGDAFMSYRPPPRPPIKAPEIQVRKVVDVSLAVFLLSIIMGANTKVELIYPKLQSG